MDDARTPTPDEEILRTPEPEEGFEEVHDMPEGDIDAPWEPSGVAIGVPLADVGAPVRPERPPRRRIRDPGHLVRGLGWALTLLGIVSYLGAVWSTADRVLRGVPDAALTVQFAGIELLAGSLALGVAAAGLVVLAIGYLIAARWPLPTEPGTPAYERYVDEVNVRARWNEIGRWVGLFLFVVGMLATLYPLRQAAGGAALATFEIGGAAVRTHLVTALLSAVGGALFLILGARQRPLDELAALTQAHRTLHARRGALEDTPWPEDAVPEAPGDMKEDG